MDRGRIVLQRTMEEVESRYQELTVHPERAAEGRALKPIHERKTIGRTIMLFDGVDRDRLAALGEVRTPSIADLFLRIVGDHAGQGSSAKQGAMQ